MGGTQTKASERTSKSLFSSSYKTIAIKYNIQISQNNMASRLAKAPLLQAKRQFAAQAAVAAKQTELGSASGQVQVSKAGNGLTVVSCNDGSPLTTIGVLVKAGSRFETYDTLGTSHALVNSVGLATKRHTAFGVTRNVQQMGTQLAAKKGREYLTFSSQVLTSKVDGLCDYLFDVVANPAFKPWELPDVTRRVGIDIANIHPAERATELLHKAAYREGLGNSIYSPPHMVGKHGPITLAGFHQKHFTSDRACLVAVGGIPHNHLLKVAEAVELGKGAGPGALAAKYIGGEHRHDTAGGHAYVAIAGDCAGSNLKEIIAGHLLQNAVGSPNVASIHIGHSDGCLIGAAIKCDAASAGEVVSKVAAVLRSVSVTDAEVKAAKKAFSHEVTEHMLNSNTKAETLARHAAYGLSDIMTAQSLLDAVAVATVADVQALAKKLANGKLSMGAVGNLGTVPYLDTL